MRGAQHVAISIMIIRAHFTKHESLTNRLQANSPKSLFITTMTLASLLIYH